MVVVKEKKEPKAKNCPRPAESRQERCEGDLTDLDGLIAEMTKANEAKTRFMRLAIDMTVTAHRYYPGQ